MEFVKNDLLGLIEAGGFFAPILFISIHLIRPLVFVPVMILCISGGLLFGVFAGTIYSVVGMTLSSIAFYSIIQTIPSTLQRFTHLKEKLFGKHFVITTPQVSLLRLIPFIHFQLLSFCLVESSSNFKDYSKSSFFTSIPVSIVYTSIGKSISQLSTIKIMGLFVSLMIAVYIFRQEKVTIKWHQFFQASHSEIH